VISLHLEDPTGTRIDIDIVFSTLQDRFAFPMPVIRFDFGDLIPAFRQLSGDLRDGKPALPRYLCKCER
jgi:hypothetical protein